jgi:hypothetical protein
MKSEKPILSRFLGLLAGLFVGTKRPLAVSKSQKSDLFRTSTQKIGVRFSEKIRSVFRGRWIKIR